MEIKQLVLPPVQPILELAIKQPPLSMHANPETIMEELPPQIQLVLEVAVKMPILHAPEVVFEGLYLSELIIEVAIKEPASPKQLAPEAAMKEPSPPEKVAPEQTIEEATQPKKLILDFEPAISEQNADFIEANVKPESFNEFHLNANVGAPQAQAQVEHVVSLELAAIETGFEHNEPISPAFDIVSQ